MRQHDIESRTVSRFVELRTESNKCCHLRDNLNKISKLVTPCQIDLITVGWMWEG